MRFSDPLFCIEKSAMAIILAVKTRVPCSIFPNPEMMRIPSTALRMLIAGVITPSPIRKEVPI